MGGRLSIPLVVSGDIDSVEQAAIVRAQSGCTAVMVARGMLGNPWLVGDLLGGGRPWSASAVTAAEAVNDLLRLFAGARSHMGDARAVRWIRSHWAGICGVGEYPPRVCRVLRLVAEANRLQAELEAVRTGFHGTLTDLEVGALSAQVRYSPRGLPIMPACARARVPTLALRGRPYGGTQSCLRRTSYLQQMA